MLRKTIFLILRQWKNVSISVTRVGQREIGAEYYGRKGGIPINSCSKADEALAPITFHHSSDKYWKVAQVATVVVAEGAFFLSMVGDGEPNYDIMTAED